MSQSDTHSGYSLYELLFTLALAALILGAGLPSLGALVADNRLRTEANALFHAIHHARKASVVRRRVVSICPSNDGSRCSDSFDTAAGWMMFVNDSRRGDQTRTPGEPVLRFHVVDPRVHLQANRRVFSLRSTELRATNGTVIFCDPQRRAAARALVISYTGRPRVSRRNRSGSPYVCAH